MNYFWVCVLRMIPMLQISRKTHIFVKKKSTRMVPFEYLFRGKKWLWSRAPLAPRIVATNFLDTVGGSEIPNNHLGCKKNVNTGRNYQPQLVGRISSINRGDNLVGRWLELGLQAFTMVRRLRGFEGFDMWPGGKSVRFLFGEDMEMFTLNETCGICMYTVIRGIISG